MVYSMTGFGRCEIADENYKFTVELKSVNHRYLDANIKLPRKLNAFEGNIRNILKEYIERGKVDVYISFEDYTEGSESLRYNESLAGEYLKYLNKMADTFGLENDIRVSSLSRYPDVLTIEENSVDEGLLWAGLEKAVRGACENIVEARQKEGENLKADLLEKLDEILKDIAFIKERSPEIMADYKKRLEEKIQEILGDRQIDDGRIATEVTIYSDKVCVDEETVRLSSHVKSAKDTLIKGGSVGRKLDFILQEMNREANTILSKANNIEISETGINLKTNIEKVREQIQNLE